MFMFATQFKIGIKFVNNIKNMIIKIVIFLLCLQFIVY